MPALPTLKALGAAVRGYRAEQHISQEELGYRAGLHRTYLSSIERGERNLSYTNVVKIAQALDIPTSELITRAEQLETRQPRQRRKPPNGSPRGRAARK